MVPIQKKGRSKRVHKDKVLDMALGIAPKSAGKKPSNRKKSNSQKPPVTETRDLLEGNRSVFVNPQAAVFPLNVAPVPTLPAIQQQTENNRQGRSEGSIGGGGVVNPMGVWASSCLGGHSIVCPNRLT